MHLLAQIVDVAGPALAAMAAAAAAAAALYLALSWFLSAGLIGLLAAEASGQSGGEAPSRRRTFALAAAESGPAFARLFLWSLVAWVPLALALGGAAWKAKLAAEVGELSSAAAWGLPALAATAALALWVSTAVAYARIELVARPVKAAGPALLGAALDLLHHPKRLAHAAIYPLIFALAGLLPLLSGGLAPHVFPEASLFAFAALELALVIRYVTKLIVLYGQTMAWKEGRAARAPEPF